ncbi:HAD-IIB family hydrolase [Salinisphaera hydrothermalis]|uniref:HAD-IIB family hydrolase n=1 Tax=Salinisphaera hydrothermalis TaxID=563188 RepID=UPI003342D2B0
MYIMHIALQGCLRANTVEYGITSDTGGHIQYLMQLVSASASDPRVERIDIVTRAFDAPFSAHDYRRAEETVNAKTRLIRLASGKPEYLDKEALHTELDDLTAALNAYIARAPRRPDFIHAHYADAAEVAAGAKACHGIPFVFTAHSLGRVKQAHGGASDPAALARRIEYEEGALARAALVFASSRDEAELQYADYENYDPGRIRIVRPGIDSAAFRDARPADDAHALLARFLTEPDKPVILAIARPVARKNLLGLVRAYGQSPTLRERANLVIVAGTRQRLADLEPELAENMRALFEAIDEYDLHGRIAYPKQHRAEDIPAIYAWARERGGVFVNPALNEPFGLTLLEAAAAGLPVVATDSGGPNDIVSYCDNGELVSPHDTDGLATAIERVLADRRRWGRLSRNGRRAALDYDWHEHANRYHALLADLDAAPAPAPVSPRARLLVCDIDGTLVGCRTGVRRFNAWQAENDDVVLAIATGRSFHSALDVLEQAGIRRPRCLITSVGSEIYHLADDGTTYRRDHGWSHRLAANWPRADIAACVADVPGVLAQSPLEQRRFKLSYLTGDDPAIATAVRRHLRCEGLKASVIHSHGCYLDVLPQGVSKGAAVARLRDRYGLPPEQVIVAGDSGNDAEMLRLSQQSIIVANAEAELIAYPGLTHAYRARAGHGRGVVEGMQYFLGAGVRAS